MPSIKGLPRHCQAAQAAVEIAAECGTLVDVSTCILYGRHDNGRDIRTLRDTPMLPTDIKSPGQLLSTALAVELLNSKHYAELAERMRHYGKHVSTELFERLDSESQERAQQISDWAELEEVALTEFTGELEWEDPLMATTYDAEARDPYRSTPYKALAYAAHNADRAFYLYTHICAITADPQTERYASILAGDALNRSRLLQSRRRRAYHKEQRGPWQQQLDAALSLREVSQLHEVAGRIQQRLTDLLDALGKHYEDLLPVAAHTRRIMEQSQQQVMAGSTQIEIPAPPYDLDKLGDNLHEDMLLIFTESERAFSFYDTVISHAFDEEIMLAAQELSEAALHCMESIRAAQRKHGVEPAT